MPESGSYESADDNVPPKFLKPAIGELLTLPDKPLNVGTYQDETKAEKQAIPAHFFPKEGE